MKKSKTLFFVGIILILAIAGLAIQNPVESLNLLVPSALTSIILTLVAVSTIFFFSIKIVQKKTEKFFQIKKELVSIIIILLFWVMNKVLTFYPYGSLTTFALLILIQLIIYGILIPYILICVIHFTIQILKGKEVS